MAELQDLALERSTALLLGLFVYVYHHGLLGWLGGGQGGGEVGEALFKPLLRQESVESRLQASGVFVLSMPLSSAPGLCILRSSAAAGVEMSRKASLLSERLLAGGAEVSIVGCGAGWQSGGVGGRSLQMSQVQVGRD